MDWSKSELDLLVDDYFRMLQAEQTGQAYNKTQHRRELMRTIDRTSASIEFKRRNISAVLTVLGLPYLVGYLPAQTIRQLSLPRLETILPTIQTRYRSFRHQPLHFPNHRASLKDRRPRARRTSYTRRTDYST